MYITPSEVFQPGVFVRDDGTEWSADSQFFEKLYQVVVIDGEHVGVAVRQRRSTRFGITDNRQYLDIAQMPCFTASSDQVLAATRRHCFTHPMPAQMLQHRISISWLIMRS
ncbi:hypothetical protein F3J34_15145 [Klebsiella sp. Ap-873]|nr:hypothetical protein [Klebsiella sp. Ap-873]